MLAILHALGLVPLVAGIAQNKVRHDGREDMVVNPEGVTGVADMAEVQGVTDMVVNPEGSLGFLEHRGAYRHGPVPSKRRALDYLKHWSKGALAAAMRQNDTEAEGGAGSKMLAEWLGATSWAAHCVETPESPGQVWNFLSMAQDEDGLKHYLFRTESGRLQYAVMHDQYLHPQENTFKVLVADPPLCPSTVADTMILTDLGHSSDSGGETSRDHPEKPEAGEPEMLNPGADPMVDDCVALFHRTSKELCGRDFDITVSRATVRIIDGMAVELDVTVKGNGLATRGEAQDYYFHKPECAFEEPAENGTDSQETFSADKQLPEEQEGMRTTLILQTNLCKVDQENGVEKKEAEDNLLQTQYMLGDLSFFKGYEHINDGMPAMHISVMKDLPDEIDWRKEHSMCFPDDGKGVVRNQANCGSCWAFAGSTSVMHTLCIHGQGVHALDTDGKRFEISVQQLMSCNPYEQGCKGGSSYTVHRTLRSYGITKERDSPYACASGSALNHFSSGSSCDSYPWGGTCDWQLKNPDWKYVGAGYLRGEDSMKQAVFDGKGMYISFLVYRNFMRYKSGVYSEISGSKLGGHAASLVGYGLEGDQKYWILQNSWGATWGENGYVRFGRGSDLCDCESRGPYAYDAMMVTTTTSTTTTSTTTTSTTLTSTSTSPPATTTPQGNDNDDDNTQAPSTTAGTAANSTNATAATNLTRRAAMNLTAKSTTTSTTTLTSTQVVKVVKVSMTVSNMNLPALEANPTIMADFLQSIKASVAEAAGKGVKPSDVRVVLKPGSVIVESSIVPPEGVTPEDIEVDLKPKLNDGADGVAAKVVAAVTAVSGIETIASGTIGVTDVQSAVTEELKTTSNAASDSAATTTTEKPADHKAQNQSGAVFGCVGGLGSFWRSLELGLLLFGGCIALMPTALSGLQE